uniref:Uncharacterized protein n=1 Tax=Romanomermis culicivorax TaxID=13658 RepID=A0A915HUE2_ROMCU
MIIRIGNKGDYYISSPVYAFAEKCVLLLALSANICAQTVVVVEKILSPCRTHDQQSTNNFYYLLCKSSSNTWDYDDDDVFYSKIDIQVAGECSKVQDTPFQNCKLYNIRFISFVRMYWLKRRPTFG